jgi:hypothetical protein
MRLTMMMRLEACEADTECTVCFDTASKQRIHNACVAMIHDAYVVRPSEDARRIKAFGKGRLSGVPGWNY